MTTRIRTYERPRDLDEQYALWLKATEALPFSWNSSLANTRAFAAHVPEIPGARLFAERSDGAIVGYVGVNEIMEWDGLGRALPFGFPWTWPVDERLEAELYDRMLASLPEVFPGERIDMLVQRFRRSWTRQLGFMRARGWTDHQTNPILAKFLVSPRLEHPRSTPYCGDAAALAAAVALDVLVAAPDEAALERRFAAGWYDAHATWLAPPLGAFAFEMCQNRAEVRLFHAAPKALATLLDELTFRALERGATQVYFTVGEDQASRIAELRTHGFAEADADVFVVKRLR